MRKLNPDIEIVPIAAAVSDDNAASLRADYDAVVDERHFNTPDLESRQRQLGKHSRFWRGVSIRRHVSIFNSRPISATNACFLLRPAILLPTVRPEGYWHSPGDRRPISANETIKILPAPANCLTAHDGHRSHARPDQVRLNAEQIARVAPEAARATPATAVCQTASAPQPCGPTRVLLPKDLLSAAGRFRRRFLTSDNRANWKYAGWTARSIFLFRLAASLSKLDPEREYVVFCRSTPLRSRGDNSRRGGLRQSPSPRRRSVALGATSMTRWLSCRRLIAAARIDGRP